MRAWQAALLRKLNRIEPTDHAATACHLHMQESTKSCTNLLYHHLFSLQKPKFTSSDYLYSHGHAPMGVWKLFGVVWITIAIIANAITLIAAHKLFIGAFVAIFVLWILAYPFVRYRYKKYVFRYRRNEFRRNKIAYKRAVLSYTRHYGMHGKLSWQSSRMRMWTIKQEVSTHKAALYKVLAELLD